MAVFVYRASAVAPSGINASDLEEGAIVTLNENGAPVEFYVAKQNYESGLNGAGRVLMVRKDCYDSRAWDSGSVNAYASSDIDAWFNGDYKTLLDAEVQDAIGTTKFYYTPGNGNETVSTLERSVFALSLTELGESSAYSNTEGSALPIANTLQIAYKNGNTTAQWTRTPYKSSVERGILLSGGGTVAYGNVKVTTVDSRPAFTLPSTFEFTRDQIVS